MKKIRKNQLAAFILSIALIFSSLQPAGVAYASTLPSLETATAEPQATETPEIQEPEETQTPAPIETQTPEPVQTPEETPDETGGELPAESPQASASPTGVEPSAIPSEDPLETPMGEASARPEETPSGLPTETPSESPSATPLESGSPTPSGFPEDLDYILGRPMTEEEIAQQRAAMPSSLPMLPEDEEFQAYDSGIELYAVLEDRYDSREQGYVTSVKNQSPFGTCWAHAALASMESSLLVAGLADTDVDLSEWHLAYFSTHTGSDKLGNTAGDHVEDLATETSYMNVGGNIAMAATALANWKGAAKELDYPGPQSNSEVVAKKSVTEPDDAWKNNAYYMSNCYITPMSDAKAVKTLIKEFGAVHASYYHDELYYSYGTAAYYTDFTAGTNHAIAVVGWDDNYKKENFSLSFHGKINSALPEGDGAWICKNSWGGGKGDDIKWGDEGYFYISYYDTSISNCSAAAYQGNVLDENLNNYYYGGGVSIGCFIYATGIAQCYEARANEGGAERIEGVGFFSVNSGINYHVQVYKNPESEAVTIKDPDSGEITEFDLIDPESGTPLLTYEESGQTTYAGYTTIEFSEAIVVSEGDTFSVVISFDDNIPVYYDKTHAMWATSTTYLYDSVNKTAVNQSFFKRGSYGFFDYSISGGKISDESYTPRMNVITRNVDAGLVGLNNFYVYEEHSGARQELGSFATWQAAVDYLSDNGNSQSDYRIAIMQDAAIKGELQMPENIHGLIVSGEDAANVTVRIDGSITAKSGLTFQNITLMPKAALQLDVGSHEVRFENVSLKGKGIAQITGSGFESGSFYTDRDLAVSGNVTNLSSLMLAGCSFNAISINAGELYLEASPSRGRAAECGVSGTLSVRHITNRNIENVISVAAVMDSKTGIWNPDFTIEETIEGEVLYIRLMERQQWETADSVEFPDGNYYAPVSFYNNSMDGEGKYFFRSTNQGTYMQFNLVKALLVDIQMVAPHPDNCLPFGGTKENYTEANNFKKNGTIVCRNQARTVVLSYEDNGRTVLEDIATYQEAIDEINALKVKRDYTIALVRDIDSVNGNSLKPGAITMPKADCIGNLTIEGAGHKICFTGNTITAASDLTLRNVRLVPLKANSDKNTKGAEPFVPVMDERAAGYQYPAAVTFKTGSYALTIQDGVIAEAPLLLSGSKGTLHLDGTVQSPDYQLIEETTNKYVCNDIADGMAGNISGYGLVTITSDFSLRSYYTAATKRTGGAFTATKAEQQADLWVQGKMTADYLNQESESRLKVGIEEDDGYAPAASDAVIKDYRVSGGCSCIVTGKFTSANKAGLYGVDRDNRVELQAGKIAFKDVTLSYAQAAADKDFAITGVLVSETEDNVLITAQKADAKGKITDVYLNVTGTVLLSEPGNQIEIQVRTSDLKEAAKLHGAPMAEGLLLNAKTADALCFSPSTDNYEGENVKLVKKGTKIYLYEAGGAPVEVSRVSEGEEVLLGFFPTIEEASKAVDAKKDKTASYVFTLHSSLGETSPEKMTLPAYAADLTLTALEERIVLHTAGDITLKSNTTLEGITLSPDYGKGTANITMGNYRLTLRDIELAENKSINKITANTKSSEGLEVYGSVPYSVGSGGITVSKLTVGENTELTSAGKAAVTTLVLEERSVFNIAQKGSVITNITDYRAYSAGAEDFSRLWIASGADLTINGSVENQTGGALAVEKANANPVSELSEITAANKILSAPKAAASSFMVLTSDNGEIPFKHEKGLYLPGDNEEELLQIQLSYGEDLSKESRFTDWYQAVTEINTIGDASLTCKITLLKDIDVTRRTDSKGIETSSPGALLLPSAGKCESLRVVGSDGSGGRHRLTFTGNLAVNTSCTFEEVDLQPIKVNKGLTASTTADITMKTDKSGLTRLVFDRCGTDDVIGAGRFAEDVLFGNVKGDGKSCEVYLTDTAFNVKGNVTGLKSLYLGMDEEGQAAGEAVLAISGKTEVKTLGLTGTGELAGTRLLAAGSLTADTLAGSDGILLVKQKSAKDESTGAVIKGNSAIPAGETMTVLVMQPDITGVETYLQKLNEGVNPFREEVMDKPLLQAPVMQAEHLKTAKVSIGNAGLELQQLEEGVVYYRDTKQYIKAGFGNDMQVKITARGDNGASASTYAKNWYEAVQMLDSMGNNYTDYTLELMGSGSMMTGFNTKTQEETTGKLLLPSKVKGTVEVVAASASASGASLVYTDNIKVPDKLTLIINGVSLEQMDNKGNVVSKGITIGNGSTLTFAGGSEEEMQFSTIAAPKGNLGLNNAVISVSGKADIKNLYVSSENGNELKGQGEIKIHTILPLSESGQGSVCLDTISKYGKSKTGYSMTQLSQLSINGSIDAQTEVKIHISKDADIEDKTEYTQEELLLASGEKISPQKRLAVVGGNAADSRITLVDGEGHSISGCLMTEEGGLYLAQETPLISVSSSGGTAGTEYQGSFRTVEAALKAIGVSAKADVALSKGNLKSYQITFESQPEDAVTLSMPSNVEELIFTTADKGGRINLMVKGNISLKSNTAFEYMNLSSVNNKGVVSAATVNAGNYKLSLIQAGVSEKITLTGGTKGELFVTGADAVGKAAALQGFGQVTMESANLYVTGNITVQNLYLEGALLKGKNITISKKTEMKEGTLSASFDNDSKSGKLKIAELCSLNSDVDIKNVLAAKLDAKGNSCLEITGKVSSQETEAECFSVELYQNGNPNIKVSLQNNMVLLKAAVADGDFFIPSSEMVTGRKGYGIYKSGKNLCYGNITDMEAELISDSGAGTKFRSLEEAIAEINSRKDKNVSYTIALFKDARIENAKGALTAFTMPSYGKKVTIKGAYEQKQISYTGKMTLKCNMGFEDIKMVTYKASGKNMVTTAGTLAGGKYELTFAGTVEFDGSVQGGDIIFKGIFEKGEGLHCNSVKAANISCEDEAAKLYLTQGGLITVTGLLKKGSVADIAIHLDYGKVPNGTKIIEIKSLSGKADLAGLCIVDTTGESSYILYQDGRAVYCRKG